MTATRTLPRRAIILAAAAWLSAAMPGMAHQFKCFATAEGATISGYAWFGGGGRPQGTEVRATAPDGTILYEGKTNDRGEFSFVARVRSDHLIHIGGGEGHAAQFTVSAAELPASLPPAAGAAPAAAAPPGAAAEMTPAGPVADESLVKQVALLRAELAGYRSEQRFRDVVAGIGYLLGLAGVAFYFLGSRRAGKGRP